MLPNIRVCERNLLIPDMQLPLTAQSTVVHASAASEQKPQASTSKPVSVNSSSQLWPILQILVACKCLLVSCAQHATAKPHLRCSDWGGD